MKLRWSLLNFIWTPYQPAVLLQEPTPPQQWQPAPPVFRQSNWLAVTALVVDPVMVAKSGDRLLREDAVSALRVLILPLAAVVTPNSPEATVLSGIDVVDATSAREAARRIHDLGPAMVVVKGGHLGGDTSDDLVFDGRTFEVLSGRRIATRHTHGTGCTFSAAICACLARGLAPLEAVREARTYVQGAIEHAEPLGGGHGPVNHLWRLSNG